LARAVDEQVFRRQPCPNVDVVAECVRGRLEREIGDVGIALILLCERTGIDLLGAIERKVELNATNYPVDLAKGKSDRPAVPRR